jgi:hypothetical protein
MIEDTNALARETLRLRHLLASHPGTPKIERAGGLISESSRSVFFAR